MQYLPTRSDEPGLPHRREPGFLASDLSPPPTAEPPLRAYWRAIKKRRWLIGGVFAAIMLLVALIVLSAPEVYVADATLLIEPRAAQILEIPQVLSQSFGADSYYETQYEILRSRALAANVVRAQAAALDSQTRRPTWLRRLRDGLSSWRGPTELPTAEEQLHARIDGYQESLSIEPSRGTRLVRVAFRAANPQLAAAMANAHAEAYIEHGLGMRANASHEAREFLVEQSGELRVRVAEAQARLAAYSAEQGIVALDDRADVVVTRLAELHSRLTEAETERVARETDWKMLRQRGPDSTPAVLESALVATLKQDLARLEGEYASLASRYRPGYPDLDELKPQVEEARRRLRNAIRHAAAGIESAYIAARTREDSLRQRVERQNEQALQRKDASVEYTILESELLTAKTLYATVQERIQQTGVAGELRDSNIFLLHRAEAPVRPSGTSKTLLLAAGAVLALVGSIGIALIAEQLDGRVRTAEELERHLGLPTLGTVPDLSPRGAAKTVPLSRRLEAGVRESVGDPAAHPPLLPRGAPPRAIEAYRRIRTNILLSQAEQPPRTLLFTSAGPGEGKTTTTLNTAQLFAQLGARVLVIDADMRKPECHRMLGLENTLGLTEILTGVSLSPESVHRIEGSFALLTSGKRPPNPTELVGSELMMQLLTSASENFDYILIDAPPLVPVSDSVLIATMVDGVVLVADQERTQREQLKTAHTRLVYARAKVLGTVLNRSDVEEDGYALDWEPTA